MRSVLDLLADAAALGDVRIRFLPDDPAWRSASELAREAHRAAGWWSGVAGEGEAVAMVLSSSFDCLAVAYGAWLAGQRLVSLPHPARGMPIEEYLAGIAAMCELASTRLLALDPAYCALLGEEEPGGAALGVSVVPFDAYHGHVALYEARGRADFVQFTSGSVSSPKGVVLSLDALGAAIEATVSAMEPEGREAGVSWLPLSHDMGFIGVCLAALAATAPPYGARGTLSLIAPEAFLASPSIWLQTCSADKATFSAAPGFAFDLAARLLRHERSPLDLSSLRVLATGAEPIRVESLRRFAETAGAFGFDEAAFCPAYGLAEATLGVTGVRAAEHWRSLHVDRHALGSGEVVLVDDPGGSSGPAGAPELARLSSQEGAYELVSCGRPFSNAEVRIAGGAPYGPIEVCSTSLMEGYLGEEPAPMIADGWLTTGDLGFVEGGELFVTGRADDVIVVAGRNLYPDDLELIAGDHPLVRQGDCAALPDGEGSYVLVTEPARAGINRSDLQAACAEVRAALAKRCGAGPSRVLFVSRGTLPKTPSGKPRRRHAAALFAAGSLAVEASA